MKKSLFIAAASLVFCFMAGQVSAQTDTTRKTTTTTTTTTTTPAAPAADVVAALNSNTDYSTASLALKSAGLESTLKSGGPYTIFAPNNNAFTKLSQGKLDSLMKDPAKLAALLKGHVATGKYDKAAILAALKAGKGTATVTALDGQTLTLSVSKTSTLQIANAAGSISEVIQFDLLGGNGVVIGVNNVLLPKQ